jgi:hypothetical protein
VATDTVALCAAVAPPALLQVSV